MTKWGEVIAGLDQHIKCEHNWVEQPAKFDLKGQPIVSSVCSKCGTRHTVFPLAKMEI